MHVSVCIGHIYCIDRMCCPLKLFPCFHKFFFRSFHFSTFFFLFSFSSQSVVVAFALVFIFFTILCVSVSSAPYPRLTSATIQRSYALCTHAPIASIQSQMQQCVRTLSHKHVCAVRALCVSVCVCVHCVVCPPEFSSALTLYVPHIIFFPLI